MRLIDADSLKNSLPKCDMELHIIDIKRKIDAAPTIEPKRGKWVDKCARDWRCSECGESIDKVRHVDGYCYDDLPNFCPNCGANMKGNSHENND